MECAQANRAPNPSSQAVTDRVAHDVGVAVERGLSVPYSL